VTRRVKSKQARGPLDNGTDECVARIRRDAETAASPPTHASITSKQLTDIAMNPSSSVRPIHAPLAGRQPVEVCVNVGPTAARSTFECAVDQRETCAGENKTTASTDNVQIDRVRVDFFEDTSVALRVTTD
jgi:hypothetical protein